MQTFLPYADLRASCQVLDGPRLGKQRVEVFQVLRALTWPEYAWKQHPAVRMWRGFVPGLVRYGVLCCDEWVRRGGADGLRPQLLAWTGGEVPVDPPLPPWFGLAALHLSHRSSLLRKDPAFYRPRFGPDEPDDLPYLWPPDLWPRWPARRGDAPADLVTARSVLGLAELRAGQAEAVEAVRVGRDCLAVMRPGHGATTTALLAALATSGTTTLVQPPLGPSEPPPPPVPLVPAREAQGSTAVPIARSPSPADLLAMRDELYPPEVHVHAGHGAPTCEDGLLVHDGADRLPPPSGSRPPLLALVPRVAPDELASLVARLGLRSPVLTGGGWDPAGTRLEVALTGDRVRRELARVVRRSELGLVLAATREGADRVVVALRAEGLRAAAWSERMRPSRAAEAAGAWRARRLDALVVPADERPPLGRVRPRAVIGVDAPGSHEAWHETLLELAPPLAVLVSTPAGPLSALASAPGCRRAALLRPVGEPVAVPCGRCDVCDALAP